MADFRLQIITQEKQLFDRRVEHVMAPGLDGYFGILANHAPFLSALGKGRVEVRERAGHDFVFEIDGGFAEVAHNHMTLLADTLTTVSAPKGESVGETEE